MMTKNKKEIKPNSKKEEGFFPTNIFGKTNTLNERKQLIENIKKELPPELTVIEKQKLFFKAIEKGDLEKVKESIKEGIDVNARDDGNTNMTPLLWASFYGRLEILKLLKDEGADLKVQNNLGENALMISIIRDRSDVTWFLTQHVDLNLKNNTDNSALMIAASSGNNEFTQLLLDKSSPSSPVELNFQNKTGKTALMEAIDREHDEIAKMLIARDADVTLKDEDGRTALSYAIFLGKTELVSLLIDAGAEVPFNYLHKIGLKNLFKYTTKKFNEVFA